MTQLPLTRRRAKSRLALEGSYSWTTGMRPGRNFATRSGGGVRPFGSRNVAVLSAAPSRSPTSYLSWRGPWKAVEEAEEPPLGAPDHRSHGGARQIVGGSAQA